MSDSKPKSLTVERSKTLAPKKTMDIKGVEEIPTSMIPVPFIKLVQPGSTNVTLSSGEDAKPGAFFKADSGETVDMLRFALLRAKRRVREFIDNKGEMVKTTKIGLLGMNLEDFTPFILTVSVSSFSNFGRFMNQLKKKKAKAAWDYAVKATTEKREETKIINNRPQKVKYWVINFDSEEKPLEKDSKVLLDDAFEEFAASLDRTQDIEEAEVAEPTPFP